LLKQERTFVRFYGAVQKIASLDTAQRQQQLALLSQPAMLNAESGKEALPGAEGAD
jgi:hypothetical protein